MTHSCKKRAVLNLLEGRLVDPYASVIIPLDNCIIVVGLLNGAELSGGLSEVAQTLNAISGNHSLASRSGLGERWPFGPV
jgi:hypothetical protein